MKENSLISNAYSVIAGLWCSPQDVDIEDLRKEACDVIQNLQEIAPESAHLLYKFIKEEPIPEEEYVELFELSPACSLYLGSHTFEEPKTCSGAAVSDRNEYMIELHAIYKHFGKNLNGKELPDYLPVMIDFLSLTTGSADNPVRKKFINEYFSPYLPPIRKRLEELNTPYLHLFDAMENIIRIEIKSGKQEQNPGNHEQIFLETVLEPGT
ncbi:MAG: nitrate reductase molybdenum cofactor assembly chaperone [Bacteroidetes bacterium]|nr:nitrate reductase molybdenum cofactor assembly chaperone [Bacteroidota bacterium]